MLLPRAILRMEILFRGKKPLAIFKPKSFSTTSKLRDDFSPSRNFDIDVKDLHAWKLIKPFFFTIAFSTASLTGAAIWRYERSYQNKRKRKKKNFWNGLHPALQIFAPICLVNCLIFLAWRAPQLELTMIRYFCSNPAARNNCWPMVLSTFSHQSFLHIFSNMYVLQSFCTGMVSSMGKEQLLGFYMAAGVVSSFSSYVYKVIANKPGLSLGASGAIMGILGYTCVTSPDIQLGIIFLPFITFKAGIAIKLLMGFDLVGCILGWTFFDHAAHLGGAVFGVIWGLWGQKHLWQNRQAVVKKYRQIRNKF